MRPALGLRGGSQYPPTNSLSAVHARTHTATFYAHARVTVTVNNRYRRYSEESVELITPRGDKQLIHAVPIDDGPNVMRLRTEKRVTQSYEPELINQRRPSQTVSNIIFFAGTILLFFAPPGA